MKRTLAFLVVLGSGVAVWAQSPQLATPRPLPVQRWPVAQDVKNDKDKKSDKDAPKDDKNGKDDKDAPKNGKNGKDEKKPAAPSPAQTAIYWPKNPFPPAAPPVLDPRTGAWEQVYGSGGVPNEHVPCSHEHIGGELHPVSAQTHTPLPVPEPVMMPAPARSGLRGWFDGWRVRSTSTTSAPKRERTINISKNWQTGSWEIDEVPHQR